MKDKEKIDINDIKIHSFECDGQFTIRIVDNEIIIDHGKCFHRREDPYYKHDCENCRFMYSKQYDGIWYDLYYCKEEPTIVARFGHEPIQYKSGNWNEPLFVEAWEYIRRAREKMDRFIETLHGSRRVENPWK